MIRVFAKRHLPVMDIVELQGHIVITPEALADARAASELRRAARQQQKESEQRGTCIRKVNSSAVVSSVDDSSCQHTTNTPQPNGGPTALVSPTSPSSSFSHSCSSFSDEWSDDEGVDREQRSAASGDVNHEKPKIPQASSSTAATASACVVEVPLGHVEQDHLSEKRCTLCIDTLRVDGSRSTYKHPLLVLKECSPARMQQLRRRLVRQRRKKQQQQQQQHHGEGTVKAALAAESVPPPTMLFSEWLQSHPDALSLNSLYLNDVFADDDDVASVSSSDKLGGDASYSRKRARDGGAVDGADVELMCGSDGNAVSAAAAAASAARLSSTPVYKNYELVGVVRGSVLFNSKPARVFQ